MFTEFLKNHKLSEFDLTHPLFSDVTDREYWSGYRANSIIERAEKYLDYEWPSIKASLFMEFKKSGNRVCMEDVHFERRNALVFLVMGELKENKGRFLPQIVDGLFSTCEESFWGLSAHWYKRVGNIPTPYEPYIDLFAAETAEHLVMAATLLRAPLLDFCPEILDRIERELEIRIKAPYLSHKDFHWMGYEITPANWNPWILSNILTVFLLTEKDHARLERALLKMLSEIQFYYDAIPEDGGCDEGVHYWTRAGASLFEFIYQLKLASGGALDLFDDRKIRNIGLYTQNAHISGARFICFADCSETKKAEIAPFIYGYGRETKTPALISLAKEVFRDGGEQDQELCYTIRRNIICADLISELRSRGDITPYVGDRVAYMKDLEIATLREGRWILAAKGGHNAESHNHNDVGTFSLYFDGEPILCDLGTGVYSKKTFSPERYEIPWVASVTHNVPEINGIGEKNGREYAASDFGAEEGRISISFGGAYPADAGVLSVLRSCALDEGGLTLTDEFEFTGEGKRVSESFVTTLPARIDGSSVIIGDQYRISVSHGEPRVEFFSFEGDRNLVSSWGCDGATRITFDFEKQEKIIAKISKCK